MSDKPIPAEVVTADQIRVGDRLWEGGGIHEIIQVRYPVMFLTKEPGVQIQCEPDGTYCRVLPEPVEVREFWRTTTNKDDHIGDQTYGGLEWIADTQEKAREDAKKMLTHNGIETATIDEVTEIIKIREVLRR